MDWTGGTRRRFAPKKSNSTLQKQKAYFAKARAALDIPSQRSGSRPPTERHSASRPRSLQNRSLSRIDNDRSVESLSRSSLTAIEALVGQKSGRNTTRSPRGTDHSVKGTHRSPSIVSMRSRGHSELASKDGINREEKLLLGNKRRLLAQNDWVGLAPARPVHMKFSSSHDKDLVGKRRKIEKSRSKRGEPAGRRLMTPLFEERLQPQDHTMSGALPTDDFQVKVGTDALATQTQLSRRSHNSGQISMRQPSTESEVLSEESMLLGTDGENIDPFQASYFNPTLQETHSLPAQQLCEVANMIRSRHEPEVHDQPESRNSYLSKPETRQREHKNFYHNCGEAADEHLQHPNMAVMRQKSQSTSTSDEMDNDITLNQEKKADGYERNQSVFTEVDEEYDEIWRNFLNVAQRMSSNTSIMAVKSTSLHMTTSESSHRPVLDRQDESDEDADPLISTPKGAGTQGTVLLHHDQGAELLAGSRSESSEKLPSPSKSLQQITTLAACPSPQKAVSQEPRNEDDIWREFICGSEDDSESSSQPNLNISKENHLIDVAKSPLPASASYIVSDLGTSNHTTVGEDTLVGNESLPSTNTQRHQAISRHETQPLNDIDSAAAQKSASIDENDDDAIEDYETTDKVKDRSRNIHAPRTSTLNPKRFLPAQKRHRPPPKRSSSFLPSRDVRKKARTREHSVYDLIDSDGNSIP